MGLFKSMGKLFFTEESVNDVEKMIEAGKLSFTILQCNNYSTKDHQCTYSLTIGWVRGW